MKNPRPIPVCLSAWIVLSPLGLSVTEAAKRLE